MGSFFSCQANRYLVKMVIAELLKIFSRYVVCQLRFLSIDCQKKVDIFNHRWRAQCCLSVIHFLVRFRAVRMVDLLPHDS